MPYRILVVDDEEDIRFTFKTLLQDKGYEVVVAEDYGSAMNVLNESNIDVLVSDIIMGQHNGIDLLQEVKNKGLRCPVIMVTGAPNIDTAAAAVRLGAFDYIQKPVTKDLLLKAVSLSLRDKALCDEVERYHSNLEAIFTSVLDGIVSVDVNLVITQANKAVEHFFHHTPDDLMGKNMRDIAGPPFGFCIDVLKEVMQTREPVREYRTEFKGKDNRQMVVVINSAPLITRDNLFIGAVLVFRDISRLTDLERELKGRQSFHKIIGACKKMQEIYTLIEALAETNTTVLITGESGTGKELVAEAIHTCGSRFVKPLVKVNCAALAENLLETELFGHVAGAFTGALKDKVGRFQMAHEGTIFLDEIGDISPALQLKLLRVLQEREFERVGEGTPIKVDVRVIAATNCILSDRISRGTFREDLYYRLNVMEIHLPSLAQRLEDIALLVSHFCGKFNCKFHKNISGVSDQVMRIFLSYAWPGNIRELENVLERAFILCNEETILTEHISLQLKDSPTPLKSSDGAERPAGKEQILAALQKARWNRTEAAEILGISRKTLYRKMKALGLLEGE